MLSLFRILMVVVGFTLAFFFSGQVLKFLALVTSKLSLKFGTFTVDQEYTVQRYVFMHRGSLISKCYTWLNEQLISLGLKKYNITPVGYLCFWMIANVPLTFFIWTMLALRVGDLVWLYIVCFSLVMMITRVYVSERMLKREMDVIDAVDLIIPDISNGVRNSISRYRSNFSPNIRPEFDAFIGNMQDRGYSMEKAMFILSDNLGSVFKDFAQKAIFFEKLGELDMVDIFADIVESNRLRRTLRYKNDRVFSEIKSAFVISSLITLAYGVFIISTDAFSRHFFLATDIGKILLIIMVLIVVCVLGYITTIKSKEI